jgi:hypothetical protein
VTRGWRRPNAGRELRQNPRVFGHGGEHDSNCSGVHGSSPVNFAGQTAPRLPGQKGSDAFPSTSPSPNPCPTSAWRRRCSIVAWTGIIGVESQLLVVKPSVPVMVQKIQRKIPEDTGSTGRYKIRYRDILICVSLFSNRSRSPRDQHSLPLRFIRNLRCLLPRPSSYPPAVESPRHILESSHRQTAGQRKYSAAARLDLDRQTWK